jgi:hypothetical protein
MSTLVRARTSLFCGEVPEEIDRYNFRHVQSRHHWLGASERLAWDIDREAYGIRFVLSPQLSLTFDLQIITMTLLRIFNSKMHIEASVLSLQAFSAIILKQPLIFMHSSSTSTPSARLSKPRIGL